jgi:hypothetical protein
MLRTATGRRAAVALTGAAAGIATVLVPGVAHAATDGAAVIQDTDGTVVIQGTCGTVKDVSVYNNGFLAATAHWELTCSGGNITMSGWVDDKRSDGKCAYVEAHFANATELAKNCPADSPRTNFKWTHSGSVVDGYLKVV